MKDSKEDADVSEHEHMRLTIGKVYVSEALHGRGRKRTCQKKEKYSQAPKAYPCDYYKSNIVEKTEFRLTVKYVEDLTSPRHVPLVLIVYIARCRHGNAFGYSDHGTCDVLRVGVESMQKADDVKDKVGKSEKLTSV